MTALLPKLSLSFAAQSHPGDGATAEDGIGPANMHWPPLNAFNSSGLIHFDHHQELKINWCDFSVETAERDRLHKGAVHWSR